MNFDNIQKLANRFLSLATNDLSNFAKQIKEQGKITLRNHDFIFTDSDFTNDIPGEYIYSFLKVKDGSIIIQYNLSNEQLILIEGIKGITKKINNASLSDLNQIIDYVDKLLYMDEISVSYTNPVRDLKLDTITNRFRSNDTDLLDVVEKTLGIEIPHGELLGAGAEGEVYDYRNNKIIKLFLIPDDKKDSVLSFLKKLEGIRSKHIANIYNSGIATRIGQKLLVGDISSFDKPIWIGYYIADKVFKIKGKKDPIKVSKLRSALTDEIGLNPWDFDANPDNIMQDTDGNYVYVDFGSVADFL